MNAIVQDTDILYYIKVLKNRKMFFIIPAVAVFLVAVAVALFLPAVYESSSTILIEQQQIPPEFVRSTVTGFADQRIQSLTQQIVSRTKLWEIIQQFNLYPEMQGKLTREEILEKMRNDIKIEAISANISDRGKSGGGGPASAMTIAFTVSYRGRTPETVQKVAGTLASLYLEQNLKSREAQAKTTTQFLEAELKDLAERIRKLGAQITAFKEQHEGTLPENQQTAQAQAGRLELEISQVDNALRSIEDKKTILEGQYATAQPDPTGKGERVLDPQTRLQSLEVALAELQAKFSPDHPDIRQLQRQIAELKKLIKEKSSGTSPKSIQLAKLRAELSEKQGKYSDQHPDILKLKNQIAQLEKEPENPAASESETGIPVSIQMASSDIANLTAQRKALEEKLHEVHQRLEQIPKVEQDYLALLRDYQNDSSKHQEVMNKILEARISEGMEEHQKGEKFTIIDPASYPEKPVSPKRWLIVLVGLTMSLGSGFATVSLVDYMDHSVKSGDDLIRLTGLPVLGSIARIRIAEDVIRAQRKRRLIWASIACSLLLGLVLFHFLYMDLWVLTAKLLRLVHKYS